MPVESMTCGIVNDVVVGEGEGGREGGEVRYGSDYVPPAREKRDHECHYHELKVIIGRAANPTAKNHQLTKFQTGTQSQRAKPP